MGIKIVGSVTDEDELDEIENVAKVFVIERRIKRFKFPKKNPKKRKKGKSPMLVLFSPLVKGLC